MDVLKVRIRDGCRGGQEQFRWNQVQSQDYKDREQYLGASTKVGTMGKFGQYYLHDWYTRKRDTPDKIEDEKESIKAYEEELMQEALGMKPKRLLLQKKQLSEEELKIHLAKEKPEGRRGRAQMGPQGKVVSNDFGEQVVEDDAVGKAYLESTIKGVGFAPHRNAKLEEYKVQAFGTTTKLEGCIKIEDGDDDVMRFGFGQTKSEPSVKMEPAVKVEKEEPGLKEEADSKRETKEEASDAVKPESSALKPEGGDDVKDEDTEVGRGEKRRRGDGDGESREAPDDKAARRMAKDEKKRKKAEKKQKKLTKKLKKAAKKAKKASKTAKKARKKAASGSSDSSSSSSS